MLLVMFLTWLFGFLAMMVGIYLISWPAVDAKIGAIISKNYRYLNSKESRKNLYNWFTVGFIFGWFLLFFYLFSLYLSNNPMD